MAAPSHHNAFYVCTVCI